MYVDTTYVVGITYEFVVDWEEEARIIVGDDTPYTRWKRGEGVSPGHFKMTLTKVVCDARTSARARRGGEQ